MKWLKWEDGKEWGEISCPMLNDEYIMTYYASEHPVYSSYSAPFLDEDGDVCCYEFDHDEDVWEESLIILTEDYDESCRFYICRKKVDNGLETGGN